MLRYCDHIKTKKKIESYYLVKNYQCMRGAPSVREVIVGGATFSEGKLQVLSASELGSVDVHSKCGFEPSSEESYFFDGSSSP